MSGPQPTTIAAIVAIDRARGIGKGGDLPWRLRGDMAYFKRVSSEAPAGKQNAVIMGRKTYESIPARFRPLPGRINIVLSRDAKLVLDGALCFTSLDAAIASLDTRDDVGALFVIGGAEIYTLALQDARCATLYVTQVATEADCDVFFPAFTDDFERVERSDVQDDGGLCYTFDVYRRRT